MNEPINLSRAFGQANLLDDEVNAIKFLSNLDGARGDGARNPFGGSGKFFSSSDEEMEGEDNGLDGGEDG